MRNAVALSNDMILTIDNAGCIGTKEQDAVQCPNEVVAYFTARTSLLEQLCAGALPEVVTLANFTGDDAWDGYMKGIEQAFLEIGLPLPKVVGSTESNFAALQSAFSISMLGHKKMEVSKQCPHWFVVGVPLVGEQVLANPEKCAPLGWLYEQLNSGAISYIHPAGSGGLEREFQRLFDMPAFVSLSMNVSSGPATSVIVGTHLANLDGFPYIEKILFSEK